MALVGDFKVIKKATTVIGDAARKHDPDPEETEISFRLESNFRSDQECLLQYEVRGLTVANEHPPVEMNNRTVGHISVCDVTGKDNDYIADNIWFQQSMVIAPGSLKSGSNVMEIKAPSWAHATTNNRYDDFYIRNIVLMYKTDSNR